MIAQSQLSRILLSILRVEQCQVRGGAQGPRIDRCIGRRTGRQIGRGMPLAHDVRPPRSPAQPAIGTSDRGACLALAGRIQFAGLVTEPLNSSGRRPFRGRQFRP